MKNGKLIRYAAIAAILLLGVYWSAASAISGGAGEDYPNAGFLATAEWLKSYKEDASLVIVDVRSRAEYLGETPNTGLAGTALFAQLHETLIPVLYDPTNMGQITLRDLFGNHAAAVAVLAVGFGLCTRGIGKLWRSGERVVDFERGPDSETSSGNAGKSD